jgi:hypothetical protein
MELEPKSFPPKNWLDPTEDMLEDPLFEAIWQTIKTWDINVPEVYQGYCGAMGNHVRMIYDALLANPSVLIEDDE